MTTIHIDEELNLDKTHFKTMEEFQLYLMMQEKEQIKDYSLSEAHNKIIDDRVAEADANPDNYVTYQEFKDSFKKK
ncbi:hypothetical protein [Aequorivita antarctica]|uniref:EF-hand domain-containing protein n=1 Tax=Aequorivita antarctica TaxID=153266 RepID=A0A5C6YWB8_9FLAO|nr:hypothetical protein [Aequorivita antarctica]TXD71855.1 hypothetical protein ESU54_14820 [Aequorivita antarctica]SRX75433.1 hypothetical protein AEQU3_02427 [Aequorivita antarctica]